MAIVELEREHRTYAEKEHELLAEHAGKWVILKDDEIVGVFDTYRDALAVGYKQFELQPFMVRKIEPSEKVHLVYRGTGTCQP